MANPPLAHTNYSVTNGIGWGILLGAIGGIVVSICAGFLHTWAEDIFPNAPIINLLWILPLLWAVVAGWIFWRKQAYFGVAFGITAFIFSIVTVSLLAVVQMLGPP